MPGSMVFYPFCSSVLPLPCSPLPHMPTCPSSQFHLLLPLSPLSPAQYIALLFHCISTPYLHMHVLVLCMCTVYNPMSRHAFHSSCNVWTRYPVSVWVSVWLCVWQFPNHLLLSWFLVPGFPPSASLTPSLSLYFI